MCIGIPMRVVESGPFVAWCDDGGERKRVDTCLVGVQPPGTWLLVFLGAAREVMDEHQAFLVRNALLALAEAGAGRSVDHLFADLIDRQPRLPPFLTPELAP